MNPDAELPPFLYGCFDWRVNGLHWDREPDLDLLSEDTLHSDNPWIVLAAVVERAKQGDHGEVDRLLPLAQQTEPFALDRVALLSFADVAPWHSLQFIERVLLGDDADARVNGAEAAAMSGALKLVPAMLSAWRRASSGLDHEMIGFAISDLLEGSGGPIADHAGNFNAPRPTGPPPPGMDPDSWRLLVERPPNPASPFPGFVEEAHSRLEKTLGAEAVVWQGRLMDVVELAREFLAEVKSPEPHNFIDFRHRFESYTGIDCRKFYFAMEPQRLQMAAVLEDFLASPEAARYQPGRRYFFGHPIPE
jgi:hypothetical protein